MLIDQGVTGAKEAWAIGRPVYARLPAEGYQNNEVTDWLTIWADENLTATSTLLQQYYKELQVETAADSSLDFLAWLVGLADEYWDTQWHPDVKRGMIAASYWLFNHIGTLAALRRVLDIQAIPYQLWQDADLRLPFTLPGKFGTPKLRYYVRVPLSVARFSPKWLEAQRSIRNYSAAVVSGKVVYQGFLLGYSTLGEPVFKYDGTGTLG